MIFSKKIIWYIFFIALFIRIAVVVSIPLEVWEYEIIATNVLEGKGFIYTHFGGAIYRSYCEPFYPFICIIVYFLTHHSLFVLGIIQAIFSSLIVIAVYFCGKIAYGRQIGLLAGMLTALHPGLIIYTTKLHPLTFDVLFITLTLLVVLKLSGNLNWHNTILAGLVSGLCVLTRPTILFFLPFALIYILTTRKPKFSKRIVYSALFLLITASIFLPWTLRNYFLHRAFMLTRSNTPYVFWLGNNPNFSGSAVDKDGRSILDVAPGDFQEKINTMDEVGQNREFMKAAFDYIKSYPFGFIARTAKKFYYFWWFSPQAGLLYPRRWLLLYKIFYIPVLVTAAIGVIFTCKESLVYKNNAVLFVLLLLSISLAQSFFYIEVRHRWAVEPILLILSSKGIISILRNLFLIKYSPSTSNKV